ncbi:MAG TPA: hypothetical protein VIY29_18090, partial [Ktedonobacteraceae bacterium]
AKTEKITSATPTTPSASTASTNSFPAIALTIGGAVLLLLLLVLLFMVFFRRRGKKAGPAAQDARPVATQKRPNPAGVSVPQQQAAAQDDGMVAFGAPPKTSLSAQSSSTTVQSVLSGTLQPWPCGHMNRSNARYCSICGEAAPQPPTSRRVEQ